MSEIVDDKKIHWKRNIILFLSDQTLSLFGSALVQYAIMWYITLTTQSGLMMTLYIICGFIPTFCCRRLLAFGRTATTVNHSL